MQFTLVTGCAGFIGYNLCQALLDQGRSIIGIDELNRAYNPRFKRQNVKFLKQNPRFIFYKLDIRRTSTLKQIFIHKEISTIFHLAARTGVRKSLRFPNLYYQVNVKGTVNLYKLAANYNTRQFIFTSSSSVYGNLTQVPFRESLKQLQPTSPYAKSKLTAEQKLKSLHNKHKLPIKIVRLFSVYGPYGRPDMAPYVFTQAILNKKPIIQYGSGHTSRDYTYINDIIRGFMAIEKYDSSFDIINLGNNHPVTLSRLIKTIEEHTGKSAVRKIKPRIVEESIQTWADITKARKVLKWQPKTSFSKGIKNFVSWYKNNRL